MARDVLIPLAIAVAMAVPVYAVGLALDWSDGALGVASIAVCFAALVIYDRTPRLHGRS
jgi:membrane protein YdbS with pleckstrin-like domain